MARTPLQPRRCRLAIAAESGAALMLALWVLAALGLIAVTGARQVRFELQATGHLQERARAHAIARGAIRRIGAEAAWALTEREDDEASARPDVATLTGIWLVDPDDWSVRRLERDPGSATSDAVVVCDVSIEDAKLPLPRADEVVFRRLGLPPAVAEELATLAASAPTPSAARLELLLATRLGVLRASDLPLQQLLTPFSTGRIVLHGASAEVLAAVPGVNANVAAAIAARARSGMPLEKLDDLARVPGVTGDILDSLRDWVTFAPRFLRVHARARIGNAVADELAILQFGADDFAVVATSAVAL